MPACRAPLGLRRRMRAPVPQTCARPVARAATQRQIEQAVSRVLRASPLRIRRCSASDAPLAPTKRMTDGAAQLAEPGRSRKQGPAGNAFHAEEVSTPQPLAAYPRPRVAPAMPAPLPTSSDWKSANAARSAPLPLAPRRPLCRPAYHAHRASSRTLHSVALAEVGHSGQHPGAMGRRPAQIARRGRFLRAMPLSARRVSQEATPGAALLHARSARREAIRQSEQPPQHSRALCAAQGTSEQAQEGHRSKKRAGPVRPAQSAGEAGRRRWTAANPACLALWQSARQCRSARSVPRASTRTTVPCACRVHQACA